MTRAVARLLGDVEQRRAARQQARDKGMAQGLRGRGRTWARLGVRCQSVGSSRSSISRPSVVPRRYKHGLILGGAPAGLGIILLIGRKPKLKRWQRRCDRWRLPLRCGLRARSKHGFKRWWPSVASAPRGAGVRMGPAATRGAPAAGGADVAFAHLGSAELGAGPRSGWIPSLLRTSLAAICWLAR